MSQQDIKRRIDHYESLRERFLGENKEIQAEYAEISLLTLKSRLEGNRRYVQQP